MGAVGPVGLPGVASARLERWLPLGPGRGRRDGGGRRRAGHGPSPTRDWMRAGGVIARGTPHDPGTPHRRPRTASASPPGEGEERRPDAGTDAEGGGIGSGDWLLLAMRGCWGLQPPSSQPSPSRAKEKEGRAVRGGRAGRGPAPTRNWTRAGRVVARGGPHDPGTPHQMPRTASASPPGEAFA